MSGEVMPISDWLEASGSPSREWFGKIDFRGFHALEIRTLAKNFGRRESASSGNPGTQQQTRQSTSDEVCVTLYPLLIIRLTAS